MNITLPYPPTGNHAVKHTANGHFATKEAKAYQRTVAAIAQSLGVASPLEGRVSVVAEICPPDRRRRDLDNAWKTLADALTKAGVWKDDHQIDDLRLIRGPSVPGGSVSLFVYAME